MTDILMFFQAAVSILLIILVLLQFGKGAEAGLFSGGGDSLMTGAQQGNILSKATVVLAILFMGNSVLLARLQGKKAGSSLLDSEAPVARPLNSDALNPSKIKTEASKKIDAVKDSASDAVNKATKKMDAVKNSASDAAKEAGKKVDAMKNSASDAAKEAGKKVDAMKNSASDAVKEAGKKVDAMKNSVKDAVE